MAERLAPFPIRVRDAFFAELEKIGVDDETKWHTEPKTKALHNGMTLLQMTSAPKPALFLRCGDQTPDPWTNNLHRDTVDLIVYCATENTNDPEGALWRLMADVQRAFRESYTLSPTILINDPVCEPHLEELAGAEGLAFGIVKGSAYYQSDDINT